MKSHPWTEEEKLVALELAGKLFAGEVAEKLVEMGYPKRSSSAIRSVWNRYCLEDDGRPSTDDDKLVEDEIMAEILSGKDRFEEEEDEVTIDETLEGHIRAPKILVFDIETTDLNASFGQMICFGYWWIGDPEPRVLKIHDYDGWDKLPFERRDRYIVEHAISILDEADVIIGHYSSGFDHPFIQTRALTHRLKPAARPVHIDTWRIAKKQLAFNGNKLVTLAKSLGCEQLKSEVPYQDWQRSKAHITDSIDVIAEYCAQDVRTTREVAEILMPLTTNMPSWNLMTNEETPRCPSCGGHNFLKRGWSYTKLYKFQRYQCNGCGKWLRDRNSITKASAKRLNY